MDTARYARFERPGTPSPAIAQRTRNWRPTGRRVGYDFAHAIVDDHSRLAYVELHDDEKSRRRSPRSSRGRWTGSPPRDPRQAADDRQRVRLHPQPLTARAARRPRDQAPTHPALPAPDQREGRALPPDHGPRVGLRPQLPLTPPPQPSPATLARALQHAQTTRGIGNRPPISRVHNLRGQDTSPNPIRRLPAPGARVVACASQARATTPEELEEFRGQRVRGLLAAPSA